MIKRIEGWLGRIDVLFNWIIVIMLGGMTAVTFAQVMARYVFHSSITWSEELSRFMFIWMTFMAGYIGARQGKHIGVEALQNALPRGAKRVLKCAANLISVVFFAIIIQSTCSFWPKLMLQKAPSMGMPIAFVYLCMIIGSLFMGGWYLILAIKALKGDTEPERTRVEEDNA